MDSKHNIQMIFFSGEEQFYPTANTLVQGSYYPTDKALDRLSEDVHNQ